MLTRIESHTGSRAAISTGVSRPRGVASRASASGTSIGWRVGQCVVLSLVGAFLVGLQAKPELTLAIFWSGVVPVLPAVFLINPGLWRNVCPLATLNTLSSKRSIPQRSDFPSRVQAVGIGVLMLLIPARLTLFNTQPAAVTAVALVAVALAVLLGRRFPWKAGFCNAICPMLPIERLYGQAPLVATTNARCSPCTLCTRRACLDLAGGKSIAQLFGQARHSDAWLRKPFGIFAGAFPGVVVGYGLASSWGVSDATRAYAIVGMGAAVSWFGTWCFVRLLRIPWRRAVPILAASAGGLFYWFVAAECSVVWGWGQGGTWTIRAAGLLFVAFWYRRQSQSSPLASEPRRRSRSSLRVPRVVTGERGTR